jgi:ABC-type antimicrobial peptide transport system permease subunit
VLRLIMGGAIRTALIGAVLGGTVTVAIGPALQPLLFDNTARDPLLLAAVAIGLLVVAIVASAWPAWRATRVDPLLALRSD